MVELLKIAKDRKKSDSDRLRAITWALERAGFNGKTDVDVRVRPWEQALEGSMLELVVDAEVVDDQPALPAATHAHDEYDRLANDREAELVEEGLATLPDADVVNLPPAAGGIWDRCAPPPHISAGLKRAQALRERRRVV